MARLDGAAPADPWKRVVRITDLLRTRTREPDAGAGAGAEAGCEAGCGAGSGAGSGDRADVVAVDLAGARLSADALNRAADDLAADLDRLCANPGLVVLRMPNCLTAVVAVVAVLRSRHALVVVHPDLPAEAYADTLGRLGPTAELTLAPGAARPQVVPEPFGPARGIWRPPASRPDLGIALGVLTSGTTGRPRVIAVPHRQICTTTRLIGDRLSYRRDDTVPVMSPLSFDYGLYQLFLAFADRATLVLDPRLGTVSGLLVAVARTGATVLPLVPTMLRAVTAAPFARRTDTSRVRLVTTTGDLLTESDAAQAAALFPHAAILPMYGLSECKRVAITPAGVTRPPGAVGTALDGTDAAVLDAGGGRARAGTAGELTVAGPHLTLGYLDDEEATAKRFSVDRGSGVRLLHTGDRLRLDDGGWLHWAGRSHDLIKTSGYRVDPAEIETAAAASGVVAECGAYGRADRARGQVPVLRVRLLDGVAPDAGRTAVAAALCRSLPSWAVARIELTETPLAHTPHGKIDRAALRGPAQAPPALPGVRQDPDLDPDLDPYLGSDPGSDPIGATVPRSAHLINCHTQALLSAFRLPSWTTPALVECATTVPFGVRAQPRDPHRLLIPWLDPDLGLDRAAEYLGLHGETRWFDAAADAVAHLDRYLRTTPVVAGPVDLGHLAYHELSGALHGCDHYVVVLGRRRDRLVVRDPEGFAQVEIGEESMLRAMAATAVPEGRGRYTLRRVSPDCAAAPPAGMVERIAAAALENIAAAGAADLGGARAYRALAALPLDPSSRRGLSLLMPSAAARQRLAARFAATAAEPSGSVPWRRLAALFDVQVRTLARAHRAVLSGQPCEEPLAAAAAVEEQILDTALDARRTGHP